jgi:3-dehydroquinate synthetase
LVGLSGSGGKAAIDMPGAKNAPGAFWPLVAVIADVGMLRTQTLSRTTS